MEMVAMMEQKSDSGIVQYSELVTTLFTAQIVLSAGLCMWGLMWILLIIWGFPVVLAGGFSYMFGAGFLMGMWDRLRPWRMAHGYTVQS